jgi:hypothetical protein
MVFVHPRQVPRLLLAIPPAHENQLPLRLIPVRARDLFQIRENLGRLVKEDTADVGGLRHRCSGTRSDLGTLSRLGEQQIAKERDNRDIA